MALTQTLCRENSVNLLSQTLFRCLISLKSLKIWLKIPISYLYWYPSAYINNSCIVIWERWPTPFVFFPNTGLSTQNNAPVLFSHLATDIWASVTERRFWFLDPTHVIISWMTIDYSFSHVTSLSIIKKRHLISTPSATLSANRLFRETVGLYSTGPAQLSCSGRRTILRNSHCFSQKLIDRHMLSFRTGVCFCSSILRQSAGAVPAPPRSGSNTLKYSDRTAMPRIIIRLCGTWNEIKKNALTPQVWRWSRRPWRWRGDRTRCLRGGVSSRWQARSGGSVWTRTGSNVMREKQRQDYSCYP